MSLFKTKNIKYHNISNQLNSTSLIIHGTLDQKNKNMITTIEKKKIKLPQLEHKLEKLKNSLIVIEKKSPLTYSIDDISTKAELKDKIYELEKEILSIQNNDEEIDYFSKTYDILNNYYINTAYDKNKTNTSNNTQTEKIKGFDDFFKTQKNTLVAKENSYLDDWMKIVCNKSIKNSSGSIRMYNTKTCKICNIEKTINSSEGYLICKNCGDAEYIILDTDRINYKDQFIETKNIGYKRMNHFSELMNQFQAKESTDIPDDIFDNIVSELKKQRITDSTKLTNKSMRSVLKKLELNNYFEHIPFIINKITGLPPPTISRDVEEKLKQMFRDIQEPFERFRPSKRKNFLNYNYVYYKFFELLEMDQFLIHFPLVKSTEKLREHDDIWKKICKFLKWQYIPSI